MKVDLIDEPELEFGGSRHVDIRFGVANYGPLIWAFLPLPQRSALG